MHEALRYANSLLSEGHKQRAEQVLIDAGIIRDADMDSVIERMFKRILALAETKDFTKQLAPGKNYKQGIPGATQKCRELLQADPTLKDKEVAARVGCVVQTAGEARRQLFPGLVRRRSVFKEEWSS
jgi:hypothetical protein